MLYRVLVQRPFTFAPRINFQKFKFMGIMIKEEFQEILEQLEKAGMNPQVCNTPVPYFDATVQAGLLTDPGDVSPAGWVMMPEDLVNSSTMMVRVKGESMRDAGIMPGDRVVVDYEASVMDGDMVVATVGSESTLKSWMTDDSGRSWLVPHNPDFEPILLTEDMGNVRIGKVVQHIKTNPRTPCRELRRIVEASRMRQEEIRIPTRQEVSDAIQVVASLVDTKRKWYAVYRVLVDCGALGDSAYDTFVQWVEEDVPGHSHLPDAQDLPRLALYSFSKPVKKWKAEDAPVSGKRFRDYCEIARRMNEELQK